MLRKRQNSRWSILNITDPDQMDPYRKMHFRSSRLGPHHTQDTFRCHQTRLEIPEVNGCFFFFFFLRKSSKLYIVDFHGFPTCHVDTRGSQQTTPWGNFSSSSGPGLLKNLGYCQQQKGHMWHTLKATEHLSKQSQFSIFNCNPVVRCALNTALKVALNPWISSASTE